MNGSAERFIDYLHSSLIGIPTSPTMTDPKEKQIVLPGILQYFNHSTPIPKTEENIRKASSPLLRQYSTESEVEQTADMTDNRESLTLKIENLTGKIDKLTDSVIKLAVENKDTKEKTLEKLELLDNRLASMQGIVDKQTSEIDSLKKENTELKSYLKIHEGRLLRAEKQIADLQEQSLDTISRNMQNNLIFHQIAETDAENAHLVINNFLQSHLKLTEDERKQVHLLKAHRIGKPGKYLRPILVQLNPQGTNIIMKNAHRLKGTKYGINVQLPCTMEERKKRLMPICKQAKQANEKVTWVRDRLFINNVEQKLMSDNETKADPEAMRKASKINVIQAPHKLHEGSIFQGCIAAVKSQDEILPALYAIKQNPNFATATHIMYAYRYKTNNGTMEHFDDDGEHGAGRRILKKMQDSDATNSLVCVCRHYGGKHLGPIRFQLIEDRASEVISLI